MRKILSLGAAVLLFTASFAAANVELPSQKVKADQIMIPVGKTGQKISYAQLATISMPDLQALTGRKMSFIERMNFKIAQSKIRKSIAADGTVSNKIVLKMLGKGRSGESGFHLGGFALGFLLGLIGVLIAYIINDDYSRNRRKWAWIGFGVIFVIEIIILASGGFAVY